MIANESGIKALLPPELLCSGSTTMTLISATLRNSRLTVTVKSRKN